jgi:hypothetical protein
MIIGVAIKYGGKIWALKRPFRHHHVRHWIYLETGNSHAEDTSVEGFIDHHGRFWDRTDALIIALENGQVKTQVPIRNDELCSESLW